MLKYAIIIYWSDEDGLYIAEAPELPGCTAHGDTYDEAFQSIKEAMSLWLDVAREFKDRIPDPKNRQPLIH
jgi:predicted RNase H-like HicB family nuclease